MKIYFITKLKYKFILKIYKFRSNNLIKIISSNKIKFQNLVASIKIKGQLVKKFRTSFGSYSDEFYN
jgi:hypothetical protein